MKARAYELFLLRRTSDRGAPETGTCNKDPRKGVSEISAGRESSGILATAAPCLQILAIRRTCASESLAQVLLLDWHLIRLLPDLQRFVYDSAFGTGRREEAFGCACSG